MNTTNVSDSADYATIFNNTTYLFWFLFVCICSIPSFLCFLFDFYHCIKCRATLIYHNITHHIILCLLVNDFVQMIICQPLVLMYFYFGYIKYNASTSYCLFWIYIDYVLINQSLIFTMHASVERYLLLFHRQFMLKYQVFTHYIPLLITSLYLPCILFYLIILFPCEQHFDFTEYECGIPCFVESQPIGLINEMIHIVVPVVVIVIFNALILIRVITLKKRTLSSSSSSSSFWQQNRRMIIQLTAICLLTSAAWIPYVISIMIQVLADPSFGGSTIFFDIINATYVPSLGTPFFVVIGLPKELRDKIWTCVTFARRREKKEPNATTKMTSKT
jgi:hypothetical protein